MNQIKVKCCFCIVVLDLVLDGVASRQIQIQFISSHLQ